MYIRYKYIFNNRNKARGYLKRNSERGFKEGPRKCKNEMRMLFLET